MKNSFRNLFPLSAIVLTICWPMVVSAQATEPVRFNRDVRPLLAENCFQCHGPDAKSREAELRLDTESGLTKKLEGDGHTVLAGKPLASVLFQRIASADPDERMPPAEAGSELTAAQIDTIRRWIEQGAKWEGHWAFLKPERPDPPVVESDAWSPAAIDRFILARLQGEGLQPSDDADRITLIRRLSFDLLGLPPTAADAENFLADESAAAYEKLVDRLLDSEHFGERMAMYWLDLVRYADSGGYHSDNAISISPYRDYVIHAFNDNMPFDQFTREQIAGDLLPNRTTRQLVASGYNRLVKTTEEGGAQPQEYLIKMAGDRLRTTAGAWLGITMGCAECHDHKYDPITTKDFYSFTAIFADVQEKGHYRGGRREPEQMVPSREQEAALLKIDKELASVNRELKESESQDNDGRRQKLEQRRQELTSQRAAIEKQFTRTMVTVSTTPRETRILPRGNWLDSSGEVVAPAVPSAFGQPKASTGRLSRLEFANWLVDGENSLTSRVFVNRLWAMFFGSGISNRLDDLGAQGEWPTHPELLDWLAVEFVESGWNVKHMVKLMVMSRTYRQSSLAGDELRRVDPDNRLYARQSRWRIQAESIRDNGLAVSGLLVRKIGGRSVKPYQPAGYWSHLNFPTRRWQHDSGESQYRRGLYTHWQRTFLHPSLLAFDAPTREECTAQRTISNTPKAALTLLNDPTHVEAARVFATRILLEGGSTVAQRIEWAWREALSRPPSDAEAKVVDELLQSQLEHYRNHQDEADKVLSIGLAPLAKGVERTETAAWTAVARAVFNLNEFITRN